MFIAVDLDGTLCDGAHKAHLLKLPSDPTAEWDDQDWTAWVEACIDDLVIQPVMEVVLALRQAGHYIEFWTGRGENAREVTGQWLEGNGLGDCPLRMRDLDYGKEPDHIWKRKYLSMFGRPDLILEDRSSVVAMWREEGIMCFQVAQGDY